MRILTVCRSLGLGGTERAAETFTLGYRDAGHEVGVLNLGLGGAREENLQRHDVPIFCAREDFDEALVHADRFDPDFVHIHRRGQADAIESMVLRRLRTGRRRVLETNVFAWADYSAAAELIDVHLPLSHWCLWAWRRRLGPISQKSPGVFVPNPLGASQFRRSSADAIAGFRAKWVGMDATFICGRVGQPLPGKWHPANILSFLPVARKDPKAFLLLIGLPDSLRPLLAKLPSDVRARIRELPMTASDEELSLFYSSLDCFLHAASQGESFGYILAEAMMCGCPVVTVSTPLRDNSQIEVVGHMQGGLVAASYNELGRAVLQLWQDRQLRDEIAITCRRRIVESCEVGLLVKRVIRVAEVARDHDNKLSLKRALECDHSLVTAVADEEIRGLAANVFGAARLRDSLLLNIANSRIEHKLRQLVRRTLGH